jgi:hypothetical protein
MRLYKWLDASATYAPDSPWWGAGRFSDGALKTLYLAETPEGAMAEFFRRHPELLAFQGDGLRVRLFAIEVRIGGDILDLREPAVSSAIGFPFDRLASSDVDEGDRYKECRTLALEVTSAGMCGIAYPSAAAVWSTWNVVLFGDPDPGTWLSAGATPVVVPLIDGTQIRPLA